MLRRLFAAAVLLAVAAPAFAQVRIKDVTDVAGARSNQLIGFGLVVGLDGTGSRSTFTQQVAVDMMQRLGVTTQIFSPSPAESIFRSTNISAAPRSRPAITRRSPPATTRWRSRRGTGTAWRRLTPTISMAGAVTAGYPAADREATSSR